MLKVKKRALFLTIFRTPSLGYVPEIRNAKKILQILLIYVKSQKKSSFFGLFLDTFIWVCTGNPVVNRLSNSCQTVVNRLSIGCQIVVDRLSIRRQFVVKSLSVDRASTFFTKKREPLSEFASRLRDNRQWTSEEWRREGVNSMSH